MSESNLASLGYIKEATFGTTPATAIQLLRRTGGALTPTQNGFLSGEIRTDLRPTGFTRTSQMVNGSFPVEWSYTTYDTMLEGMLMNTFTVDTPSTGIDQLVDGTTKTSFTFEEYHELGATDQYIIAKGCRIGSMTASFALDRPVTGTLGIIGATPSIAQATVGTGGATAATTTGLWNTVDMITTLADTSVAMTRVVGVDLSFDRSLRPLREIGTLNPFDIGVGRLMVTGTIQQYFEDDVLMDAWFGNADRDLQIVVTDGAGNTMDFTIPKLRYTGDATISNPGPDGDRITSVSFEAYSTTGNLIEIERNPV